MTTQRASGVSGTEKKPLINADAGGSIRHASASSVAKNRLDLMRRHDLQLRKRAVAWLLVQPPATKLRSVSKTISLHVVVSHFDHQLRSQRFPRQIFTLTPATLRTRNAIEFISRPFLPRM